MGCFESQFAWFLRRLFRGLFQSVGVLILATACFSCAGKKARVEVTSEPGGAEVVSFDGEKMGSTPLILEGEQLAKATKTGSLAVFISAPGYVERELVVETHGTVSYVVRLTRLDRDYFSKRLLNDFAFEANEMARELMQIQGLVLAGKLPDAEKALNAFQKKFPNVAASYVLFASIESQRGKGDQARRYLARAREIDPNDPVVIRMMNSVKGASP